MTLDEKHQGLKEIKDELLNLTSSPLYEYRQANKYYPVIGEGNHEARVMFVGEAPGKNEALTAKPFCGASGRILDELLNSIGLKRSDVYVTNIVKDRPPANRDPSPEEIIFYGPFLDRQIEIIEPEIIATLGRFSMKYILDKFDSSERLRSIGELHGRVIPGSLKGLAMSVLPLYHPAAAIYNQALKNTLFKDFQVLKVLT
ncbi:MAG: hypothetical protein A2589_00300 [Candidatus Vogelbacteria bacterium RIFOXYD1_FULL_46_19]|uniref:Type-4 uracil-DNA glycosylase n=1 Tax=Candidatus Vogelbacteria bacterium RIFOXYD1_FULL_46_19 TaxID=1802439 RepID=A0A1G2QJ67_9BACT|nr:MAG: hypothetical protein A2589_00300 [Candidatus Vogelbacteria bacterium RIFOXYD1_FULL_46_19]